MVDVGHGTVQMVDMGWVMEGRGMGDGGWGMG
jgi:hypothetical protein